MKKSIFCIASLLTLLCACGPKEAKSNVAEPSGSKAATTQLAPADTLAVTMFTRHKIDSMATSALNVEFPVANKKKAPLVTSINEWISEQLGGTYAAGLEGDYAKLLSDTTAVMNHYFASIEKYNATNWHDIMDNFEGPERPELELYDSIAITKKQEGEQWITMQYVNSVYLGGAHGSYLIFGQTFRKSDGRRIDWDLFSTVKMQSIIRDGLKEYFEVKTDDELAGCLTLNDSFILPMPVTPPLFGKDGIIVTYQQYEIASYAAGMPSFVIPYKKAKDMMNNTGKKLIE